MISKLRPGYVVREPKKKKKITSQAESNFLSRFSIQTDKLTSLSVNKNSLCTHNQLHVTALPDIWHYRMSHIGSLGFYKLGKKYLRVQLQEKTISQWPHCALSKMIQQISQQPPANKLIKLFHQMFVDWLDLEKRWDTY